MPNSFYLHFNYLNFRGFEQQPRRMTAIGAARKARNSQPDTTNPRAPTAPEHQSGRVGERRGRSEARQKRGHLRGTRSNGWEIKKKIQQKLNEWKIF